MPEPSICTMLPTPPASVTLTSVGPFMSVVPATVFRPAALPMLTLPVAVLTFTVEADAVKTSVEPLATSIGSDALLRLIVSEPAVPRFT